MISSDRKRRRRVRLALILGVILLIAGGVTVRYLMVRGDAVEAVDPRRDAGLTAFEAGDTAEALKHLGPYAQEHPDDTEVVFALARTQLRLAEGDPALLMPSVGTLRQVLRNDPGHREAAELLLPLLIDYPQGVEDEGLKTADRLLRVAPEHPTALRARAVLLPRTGRTEEAMTALRAYLAEHPTDVMVQRLTLDVMKLENPPNSVLLEHSRDLREQYPDDPAMVLVEAHARLITEDRAGAVEWLEKSIEQTPPDDEEFVKQQVRLMDAAGMFPRVLTYLNDLHEANHEALPLDELIRRRFEAGQVAQALEMLEELARPTMMHEVLHALALLSVQRGDDAAEVIDRIAGRPGRPAAATAGLIDAIASTKTADMSAVLAAAREADDAGVDSPYLNLLVAEAYEKTGEPDRAVTRYESVLRQRPSWTAPCLGLSQIHLDQGNATKAVGYAVAAVQRQPQSVNARVLLAQAFGHDPSRLDATQKQEVLSLIDQVQRAQPGEPRTLVLRIAVLAGTGESRRAAAALDDALALDPPLTEAALVRLIEAGEKYGVDPEGRGLAAYVERFGQTLPITMVQAIRLGENGDTDAALALFDRARPASPDAEWDVNRALLLERLGHEQATEAWGEVARAYPKNRVAQGSVLSSAAAWNDRPLIEETIERLKTITGDDATRWRVERARWLLTSADPLGAAEEADGLLDAVLKIEPELVSALALRGRSQRLLGKQREAVSLLEKVTTLAPENADARIELALAQRETGARDQALESARAAAYMDNASPHVSRRAAQFLIEEGELRPAATVLGRLHQAGQANPRDVFMLAQLYRQTRQQDRAVELIESMLETPNPATVALAADLYAQSGMDSRAEQTLALLDEMDLTPGQVSRVRAVHQANYGSVDEADAAYAAVVEAEPTDASAWRDLVGYRLRTGRPAEAVAAAREGVAALPDQAGLSAVIENAEILKRLDDVPEALALSVAVLEDDTYRGQAIKALGVLDASRRKGMSAAAVADRIAALADEAPGFEPMRALAVARAFEAGRVDDGLARASAAMEDFPNSASSARLAAEAWGAAGRWREALLAAEAWGARLTGNRSEADALAARAHRELGRAAVAMSVIAPHRDAVEADPLAQPMVTRELALSLAANGQAEQAEAILEPLLTKGKTWRMAWLDAAVLSVTGTRQAGQWLETVERAIPAEAVDERASLAQAWWTLGLRDSYPAYLERGRSLADELAQRPDASAALWFFIGTMAEAEADLPAAGRAYREALRIDPKQANANNNLAMVLAQTDGDLDEAVRLAERAIVAVPTEPNYYDTLAFVHLRAGRVEDAERAIQQAIKLDPGNPTWRNRLNEVTAAAE